MVHFIEHSSTYRPPGEYGDIADKVNILVRKIPELTSPYLVSSQDNPTVRERIVGNMLAATLKAPLARFQKTLVENLLLSYSHRLPRIYPSGSTFHDVVVLCYFLQRKIAVDLDPVLEKATKEFIVRWEDSCLKNEEDLMSANLLWIEEELQPKLDSLFASLAFPKFPVVRPSAASANSGHPTPVHLTTDDVSPHGSSPLKEDVSDSEDLRS